MTPLNVLVVEDEPSKREAVALALVGVSGMATEHIDFAEDAQTARRYLATTTYDLLILDIYLPERPDQAPSTSSGIRLLEDLETRDGLRSPSHIVGLTAYDEAFNLAKGRFWSRLLMLVEYDSITGEWEQRLQAFVRHLLAARADSETAQTEAEADLGIVCALQGPELRCVLKNGWKWEQYHRPFDSNIYWRANYDISGRPHTAYAVAAPQIGTVAGVVTTLNLIHAFRPALIAMVGISAGVRGRVNLGDLIVADPSWEWDAGKLIQTVSGTTLLAAPRQISLDGALKARVQMMAEDRLALEEIRSSWTGEAPGTPLVMHVGPVASGSSVVADPETVKIIQGQHRNVLGIEMEGYGVFAAAEGAAGFRPKVLVIKSVVDFADADKNDRFQSYGAHVSAQAIRLFVERF